MAGKSRSEVMSVPVRESMFVMIHERRERTEDCQIVSVFPAAQSLLVTTRYVCFFPTDRKQDNDGIAGEMFVTQLLAALVLSTHRPLGSGKCIVPHNLPMHRTCSVA